LIFEKIIIREEGRTEEGEYTYTEGEQKKKEVRREKEEGEYTYTEGEQKKKEVRREKEENTEKKTKFRHQVCFSFTCFRVTFIHSFTFIA